MVTWGLQKTYVNIRKQLFGKRRRKREREGENKKSYSRISRLSCVEVDLHFSFSIFFKTYYGEPVLYLKLEKQDHS